MPLQATSGAASYDAFGGGVAAVPQYIEDVFSTWLYTGNNSTQTITNGVDLSTKGGLVWIKGRNSTTIVPDFNNILYDTARGVYKTLQSNTTGAEGTSFTGLTAFTTSGFSLGSASQTNLAFGSDIGQYASWTFRKQPKFFDVVTYTGDGTAGRTVAHNLGSVPGCIIIKTLNVSNNWAVYHQSVGNTGYLVLNSTSATQTASYFWNNTSPTSSVFTLGDSGSVNGAGNTYVAYVFAHNAGGFGLTGTDNVISCGSYTGNGSSTGPVVTLGYEPQWVMIKNASNTGDWVMFDNMRGLTVGDGDAYLYANTSAAESTGATRVGPSATGFYLKTVASNLNTSGETYIYIAIRRGPMKVPTVGTSVFSPVARNGTGATAVITTPGFPPDMTLVRNSNNYADSSNFVNDRLRGNLAYLKTQQTSAEASNYTTQILSFDMLGFTLGADQANGGMNYSAAATYINYFFRRAPSFFDEVCYTGNGAGNNAQTHNLGVAPELLIIKNRSSNGSGDWYTFHTFTSSNFKKQLLDTTDAQTNYTYGSFLDAQPTSTTFTVNSGAGCNASGTTYVAYLFATCAGVSKVGSYTGNGTTQTIDCGFTGGARFVLIKRTDSTGDWYVYDTARGMTTLTDPYLALNTTTANTATLGSVTTVSTGFALNSAILAAINVNGGSYIFLAIA